MTCRLENPGGSKGTTVRTLRGSHRRTHAHLARQRRLSADLRLHHEPKYLMQPEQVQALASSIDGVVCVIHRSILILGVIHKGITRLLPGVVFLKKA